MTDDAVQEIPDSNRTTVGLYVSAQQAYAMWKEDPTSVHILDVRTFEEYLFVGHFEFAKNVPLVFPRFDPKGPSMPGRPPGCSGVENPDFLPAVQKVFGPTDTILVMCSTGGRAAMAVNSLAQAGYAQVYNIVHGFEGDRIEDPGSVFAGKHMRNGWKNAGLPWGYDFHPDLMWVQHQP
ncbi:MAG: rhodanese-like domain-containing protein [Jiangellales bacterium]